MPLLASQSHEDQLEYVQEHDKITDSLEISGSNEMESGSTGKLNLKDKNAVETIYDIQCHLWKKYTWTNDIDWTLKMVRVRFVYSIFSFPVLHSTKSLSTTW